MVVAIWKTFRLFCLIVLIGGAVELYFWVSMTPEDAERIWRQEAPYTGRFVAFGAGPRSSADALEGPVFRALKRTIRESPKYGPVRRISAGRLGVLERASAVFFVLLLAAFCEGVRRRAKLRQQFVFYISSPRFLVASRLALLPHALALLYIVAPVALSPQVAVWAIGIAGFVVTYGMVAYFPEKY